MSETLANSGEQVPGEKESKAAKNLLTLEVLAIIKQSQSEHGLKHGDYQRYRQYCTKRIRRIRKALSFVQSSGTKNRSVYHQKEVSSQMVFENKKPTKDALRLLYIPLMGAERCWAYAMQLKQESSTEPRKKFHMARKFRKAVFWAVKLRDLCNEENSKCDARTKLETCAYADYLQGLFYFETDQWQKASDLLKNAQNIYEQLFSVINDEEILLFYKQKVEEIKPTLRYCAFNIGEQGKAAQQLMNKIKTEAGNDNLKIEQLINQTRAMQVDSFSEIDWLGKMVFVKHEKIRTFLLQLKDTSNKWDFAFYEQMIFECRDCLQLLRDTNSDKSSLYVYLTYIRLDLIAKRNLQLIQTLHNHSDLLRQYEIIIGCYNEIKSLNISQFFTDHYLVEKFFTEIDAQIIVYKAYRCYYIGHVAKHNWKESIALLDRAAFYCKEALNNEYITSKETKDDLRKLLSKADADKFAIYAENISKDNEENKEMHLDENTLKEPLINRLNYFVDDPESITENVSLVAFPPDYETTPAKPLFFDLALNHIQFPSLEEEINADKAKSGLTGMVKGWLGGWRK